jgi:hypothetical protein
VLPAGRSVDDVVDVVLACRRDQLDHSTTIAELTTFGLSDDDAEVAVDRVCGGLVRASTGDRSNKPSRKKDPLAHASYRRALADPSLTRLADPFEAA